MSQKSGKSPKGGWVSAKNIKVKLCWNFQVGPECGNTGSHQTKPSHTVPQSQSPFMSLHWAAYAANNNNKTETILKQCMSKRKNEARQEKPLIFQWDWDFNGNLDNDSLETETLLLHLVIS